MDNKPSYTNSWGMDHKNTQTSNSSVQTQWAVRTTYKKPAEAFRHQTVNASINGCNLHHFTDHHSCQTGQETAYPWRKIQTLIKITLFIRTKHNMHILGVIYQAAKRQLFRPIKGITLEITPKRMPFIRTKHNMQIFRVIPFISLQNMKPQNDSSVG